MSASPDQLAGTHAAAFENRRPWSSAELAALLAKPGMILCGDARSFLLGRVMAAEAEVLTVATHPTFQRQGLARTCLRDFLSHLQQMAAEKVFLEVAEDNVAAKSLYSKEGFLIAGRRKGYYTATDGTKSDAIVMQKLLH